MKTCPIATEELYYETGLDSIYTQVDDVCTWQRKLCVMCVPLLDSDKPPGFKAEAAIRVISNNMPTHCFSTNEPPVPTQIDF